MTATLAIIAVCMFGGQLFGTRYYDRERDQTDFVQTHTRPRAAIASPNPRGQAMSRRDRFKVQRFRGGRVG